MSLHREYCLTGRKTNAWQTTDEVLALFSDRLSLARRRYREYLKKGIGQGRRADLMGGGLVRSAGGWAAVRAMRKAGVFSKSDERVLCSSDFVEDVLSQANERMEKGTALKAEGIGYDQVVTAVADLLSLQPRDLFGPGKERTTVKGRILVCYWTVKELGMSMTEVAKKLGISVPTVSVAVKKGRKIVYDEELLLADILNIKM